MKMYSCNYKRLCSSLSGPTIFLQLILILNPHTAKRPKATNRRTMIGTKCNRYAEIKQFNVLDHHIKNCSPYALTV